MRGIAMRVPTRTVGKPTQPGSRIIAECNALPLVRNSGAISAQRTVAASDCNNCSGDIYSTSFLKIVTKKEMAILTQQQK